MKLLNEFKSQIDNVTFDLKHETKMVQARILSTLLQVIDDLGYTQTDLAKLTGISQPFISNLLNNNKSLSMEHLAKLQKALGIILQPPSYLSDSEHFEKFYSKKNYDYIGHGYLESFCDHDKIDITKAYLNNIFASSAESTFDQSVKRVTIRNRKAYIISSEPKFLLHE